MKKMIQRESVVTLCEQLIAESKAIKENTGKHFIIQKVANHICERASEIKDICSVDKYDIYFNGKVEVGKSTAICNLFNLVDRSKFTVDKRPSDALLLKTASGRTTVCETVITQIEDDKSKIIVDPVSVEEFHVLVREYIKAISPNYNADTDSLPPEELIRALKNMLHIPSEYTSNEDRYQFLLDKFMVEHTEINQNELVNMLIVEVSKYINYENRTQIEYCCESGDFNEWLKKHFNDINDGRLDNCPLPSKIYIDIRKNDIDMGLPNFISRVIDTRGIDGGQRKDIQDVIKNKKSISIMNDEIGMIGGNADLMNIMKQVLVKENMDLRHRVFLIGLERDCELSDVPDADGNRESGKKIKTQQAINRMKKSGINFSFENIAFYNSFYGIAIASSNKKIMKICSEQYDQEKNEFFNFIEDGLKFMYSGYRKELMDLLDKVKLLEKNSITEEVLIKLDQSKDAVIVTKEEAKHQVYDLIGKLEEEIQGTHPSVLRASVNRLGIYPSFNLYATIQKLGGEEFTKKCLEVKRELVGNIKGRFGCSVGIEEVILQTLLSKIDLEYYNYYEKSRALYYEISDRGLHNVETWEKPLQYWGDGNKKYRERVTVDILREVMKKEVQKSLSKFLILDLFFDGLVKFMDFNQQ
ncbi:hypothetical protein BHU72_01965 [Desulfuribacillus stibiiarsenatis]|uniref:Dynamin family protein n=1 Tax=Desulfuribacillus stibiiarsenatis TaxID=1390249 RepID=A0A1E5L6G4_9FIRM|nr:hypothetical protein [Desulfuribacillus stibiiarsenatis]OEH85589.1 hypothetical protein BHU72_01965 [Desulfuribacillus stibiiarsenatis]